MDRRQWEQSLLPCPEPFGYWFSGLIDGEGCFSIDRRKHGYLPRLTIKLRADDRAVLEMIREELGTIGTICSGDHSGPGFGNPWIAWSVAKKTELIRLTEVLDAFPLRTKKARDYAIWREAAIEYAIGQKPYNWASIERAYEELKWTRGYDEILASAKSILEQPGFHREGRRHV